MPRENYILKVRQVESTCIFELSWGQGQSLMAQLPVADKLAPTFQQWQQAYLGYYRHLRARPVKRFEAKTPVSQRRQTLVDAESQWLQSFHHWLQARELAGIRQELVQAAYRTHRLDHRGSVDLFLSCSPQSLAEWPWETWPFGADITNIRIARMPENITLAPMRPIRRRARILAVMGDDTGLVEETTGADAFGGDRQALQQLDQNATLTFFTPKPNETSQALSQRLCQTLTQIPSWDVLFFAGHSQENPLGGGQLWLAPQVSISLQEIEAALLTAKKQGLQLAIFNSCDGLDLAQNLLGLGLSQVVVMREPIHNQAAQGFLQAFLQQLAQHQDGHTALINACRTLRQAHEQQGLIYPSAYLVPSIFRHPQAPIFRIETFGWRQWQLTRTELVTFALIFGLSLLPGLQDLLLNWRLGTQALYRQMTQQLGDEGRPKALVVKIDEDSRRQAPDRIKTIRPINYSYLADIVKTLQSLDTKVLGIDYILDDSQQSQGLQQLGQTLQTSIDQGTRLVLGATATDTAAAELTQPQWRLEGDISFFPGYLELPTSAETYPFAYLLAWLHHLEAGELQGQPAQGKSMEEIRDRILQEQSTATDTETQWLSRLQLSPVSSFAGQGWLQPILDFSLPPEHVYESISAYQLLEGQVPAKIEQQVVLIVPWEYEEAGVAVEGADNFPLPAAIRFWRGTGQGTSQPGGESHAYMLHSFLNQHLVIPIPASWLLFTTLLFSKGLQQSLQRSSNAKQYILYLAGTSVVGMGMSWQAYISLKLLLPYSLPLILFWSYVYLALKSRPSKL